MKVEEELEELKKEIDETTNLVTLLEQRYRVSVLIMSICVHENTKLLVVLEPCCLLFARCCL